MCLCVLRVRGSCRDDEERETAAGVARGMRKAETERDRHHVCVASRVACGGVFIIKSKRLSSRKRAVVVVVVVVV